MRALIKMTGTAGIIVLMLAGCSAFVTINERAMSLEDVINLSKVKLDSEVIIRQIEVTRSKFELTSDEIVMLKNEGVDDDVIEYMIETEFIPEKFTWDYGYSPYNYWYYHYNYAYYPMYDYYYNPYSMYSNWGMPYYRSPYTVRRRPGLVGRYYDYYPVTPPPGREYYQKERYQERRPEERKPEEGK